MRISEVSVKLVNNAKDKLKAFCSMTIDGDFVIRDIKIIEGSSGIFVAMPSRKMSDHCEKCGGKNHLRARYCNNCGTSLKSNRAPKDSKGRMKLYADIAHPINAHSRLRIQETVIEAFHKEIELSKQPGYQPVELDECDDDIPDFL